MGGIFGRGGGSPAPKKPEKQAQKPDMERREQAAAMQARRGQGAAASRSLLSGARQDAQTGLTRKLGGGQ